MKPQRTQRKNPKNSNKYPYRGITEKIIGCAREVHASLGPGLKEKIYEEAMAHEMKIQGVKYKRQKEIGIKYKGKLIGNYRLDYLIENKVIVELKSVESLKNIHIAQIVTYLKAKNLHIGLLINFNTNKLKDGIKRIILPGK